MSDLQNHAVDTFKHVAADLRFKDVYHREINGDDQISKKVLVHEREFIDTFLAINPEFAGQRNALVEACRTDCDLMFDKSRWDAYLRQPTPWRLRVATAIRVVKDRHT